MNILKRFVKKPLAKNLLRTMFITISEKNSSELIALAISNYFNKQKKRMGFFFLKTLNYLILQNYLL